MAYYYLHRFFLRDLYQPHTWYTFDGPYTRLQMDDGSSFIFIMSSVWRARKNPFLCHLSYSPLPSTRTHRDPNEIRAFNCNFYPRAMGVTRRSQHDKDGVAAFTLSAIVPSSEVPGRPKETGTFQYEVEEEVQRYNHTFCHPQDGTKMDIQVDITDNTPHSVLGPMWIARFLPVPLKWHIFSTRSRALVTVKDSESGEVLLKKKGLAHQEKNWGLGFPEAWIWCQGFHTLQDKGSLAIAGGKVTSFLTAFMLAYRSPTSHRKWDFGPALTTIVFGKSLFGTQMTKCESENGELELVCVNPIRGRKIVVRGRAPVESFQMMSAPLPKGHTEWYCHESFEGKYTITLLEKKWFKPWQEVEKSVLDNSAIEFGGTWSHWWNQYQGKEKGD